MRRFLTMLIVGLVLVACGGAAQPTPVPASNDAAVATSVAATIAAGQTNAAAATSTPDNTVATVAANATNTSFATALLLDGKMTASVKESTFYYKLEVPVGGVVTSTLSVDKTSPSAIMVNFFDKEERYISQGSIGPGETLGMGYAFGAPNGGPVYWAVSGEATFTLAGVALKQNDAETGGDAPADGAFDEAKLIAAGAYTGVVGDGDRADLYAVELPKKGGRFSIDLSTKRGDLSLQTFDNEQNYIDAGSASAAEPATTSRLIPVKSGGRWYVRVDGEGEYALKIAFTPQDDGKSGGDAADYVEYSDAPAIKLGEHQGELGDNDRYDLYAIDLPKDGGTLTVSLKTERGTLDLQTFDNERNYMDSASINENDPAVVGRVLPLEDGGRWFIQVGGEGSYTLSVAFMPQNDADSKKDAAGYVEYDKALPVSAATFSGGLGNEDQYDIYKVRGSLGRNVKVVVLSGTGSVNIQIFDNDRNYGPNIRSNGPDEEGTLTVEGDQDYYIQVEGDQATYRIEITP
ncbi:MAG: PPC domain-containing protein [Herpetosiphonaceae bacterium]|nr:PPC domain-containing protein [Herpetosiphonaceae bacterium]